MAPPDAHAKPRTARTFNDFRPNRPFLRNDFPRRTLEEDASEDDDLGVWSLSGSEGSVHARYFGANGKTLAEIDHQVIQTGSYGYYRYSADVIAGVEISRNSTSPDDVCIDNFASFDENQLEKLKATTKTNLTIDDLSS
jgi:hypothetical protein